MRIKKIILSVCLAFACVNCGAALAQTANDDEAALRLLADHFYHAYEPDDQTVFLSLWSSRSIDPESKPNPSSKWTNKRVESFQIETVIINKDTAKVRVKVRLSGVLKPGAKVNPGNLFLNQETLLTLRCVK